MKIYVGNLTFYVTEDDINELFKEYGNIESVVIVKDSKNGKSKGFGFIEMPFESEAKIAIDCLDGVEFKDRELIINEAVARPKTVQKKGLTPKEKEKKDAKNGSKNNFFKKRYNSTTKSDKKEEQTDRKPRRQQGTGKNDQTRNRAQTDQKSTFQSKGRSSQGNKRNQNKGNR